MLHGHGNDLRGTSQRRCLNDVQTDATGPDDHTAVADANTGAIEYRPGTRHHSTTDEGGRREGHLLGNGHGLVLVYDCLLSEGPQVGEAP